MANSVSTKYEGIPWTMELIHGTTWPAFQFTITDSQNNPRNLSGATISFKISPSGNEAVIVKELTVGNGFVIGGTGNNVVTFSSTLIDMARGYYTGYIIIAYPNGQIKPYFKVSIQVK